MKQLSKILAAGAGLFALLCLGAYALIESGEVVVLRAAPEDGHGFLARLWVVDYDERPWISTTDPSKTDWVPWLRGHETVEVERGGIASCRRPVFTDKNELRSELNTLLNAKYRIPMYGSHFLRLIGGAESNEDLRIWIRLDPCGGSGPAARDSPPSF